MPFLKLYFPMFTARCKIVHIVTFKYFLIILNLRFLLFPEDVLIRRLFALILRCKGRQQHVVVIVVTRRNEPFLRNFYKGGLRSDLAIVNHRVDHFFNHLLGTRPELLPQLHPVNQLQYNAVAGKHRIAELRFIGPFNSVHLVHSLFHCFSAFFKSHYFGERLITF
jgi:hypothetical protein